MGILWIDGFERAASGQYANWYEGVGSYYRTENTANAVRTGANGLSLSGLFGGTYDYVEKQFASNYATLYVGFMYFGAGADARRIFSFYDGATEQLSVRLNTQSGGAHTISIYHGDGTTVLGTSTETYTSGTQVYIEISATFHNTAGAFEVKINGTSIVSGSGANTRQSANNYANRCRLQGLYNTTNYFDDYYIADNAYQGAIKIEKLTPNANGNYSQWTGSDADQTDNYLLVDEATANSDTDYVKSANVGDIDSYACSNLSSTSLTIKAVQVNLCAKKDDALSRQIGAFCRSGSTDSAGTGVSLTTSYAWYAQLYLTDPATAAAWAATAVNAAEFGGKVIA